MAVRNTESHGSLFHGDDSRRTSPEGHGLETGIDVDLRDGDERECLLDRPPELQDSKSNAVLLAQGHKAAMQRSFSPLAALGLGFSITNSWVGYLSCFGQNLAYAGPNSVIFGLLLAAVIQWTISLGLSEIASCFPSSGGQYHFVFILAPKRSKRFAAFVVGWMNILGWSVALSSGVSVVVASITGLVAFWDDTFLVTQWGSYVIYLAVAVLSLSPLFLGPRLIPQILQASLAFSVTGLIIIFCLLLALRKQSQPLSFLLITNGTSGWGIGAAWMLGLGNSMYAFSSTDAVLHIAEEMSHPERRLPQVVNLTMTIGFMTAFPLLLVMMLSMADINAVLQSPLPYAEVFRQITDSKIRGLPYPDFFSHISERYGFPVRTTILALGFCSAYGILYIASTTAFNSIITSAVLFSNITYASPQGLVAARGRKKTLPEHPFDLGRLGYVCNFLSPIFVIIVGVLICFPPELPVTRQNANYTPVVLVGFVVAILGFWVTIGKKFEGPKIDWEVLRSVKVT
ncbi:MAG: HNM1-Choline permease [Lasallia pustulata]|uniref:HNM1-Choline permease n=1 Tax=Lasallia pustulata TaxID=136370 RepID=A0A5M8PQ60_9LECA|nr:MAG: HNM1-Choline permease [Lasallia pustulata]